MQVTLSFFYNLNFRFVSMGCCDICWILYDEFLDISLLQSSSRNWRSFLFNHRTSNHCRLVYQRLQIKGFGLFLFCHPCRNWSWIRSRLKRCCRSFRLEMGFTRYSFHGPGCPFIDCVFYDWSGTRSVRKIPFETQFTNCGFDSFGQKQELRVVNSRIHLCHVYCGLPHVVGPRICLLG